MSFSSQRKKAGISQADVARAIGVSTAAVNYWETKKTLPDARKLPRLAALFHCTVDAILSSDGEKRTGVNQT